MTFIIAIITSLSISTDITFLTLLTSPFLPDGLIASSRLLPAHSLYADQAVHFIRDIYQAHVPTAGYYPDRSQVSEREDRCTDCCYIVRRIISVQLVVATCVTIKHNRSIDQSNISASAKIIAGRYQLVTLSEVTA